MLGVVLMNKNIYPMFQAILAAVLFGASAPISKLLLGEIEPIPMAAFLYLGSGIGLLLYRTFQKMKVVSGRDFFGRCFSSDYIDVQP